MDILLPCDISADTVLNRMFSQKIFKKLQKNHKKSIDFISLKRYTFKHQKQNRFRKDFKGYEKHESF
ncbi:MAG: hypothetical protein J6J07_06470 [Oscillospiraceae bacterium]|nr:hypothetical protein [Oscillospiraceae bacterium]MBQ5323067.1 hypothetical protein [Oscillospiraceae bacterium]